VTHTNWRGVPFTQQPEHTQRSAAQRNANHQASESRVWPCVCTFSRFARTTARTHAHVPSESRKENTSDAFWWASAESPYLNNKTHHNRAREYRWHNNIGWEVVANRGFALTTSVQLCSFPGCRSTAATHEHVCTHRKEAECRAHNSRVGS